MIWLLVGLAIGVTIGVLLMAMLSINRHRDTQAVADLAVSYVRSQAPSGWHELARAVDRLMAE